MIGQQTGQSGIRRWMMAGAVVMALAVPGLKAHAQGVVPVDPRHFPLSPQDPNAHLDPELRDFAPIPVPIFAGTPSELGPGHNREIRFHVETGQEGLSLLSAEERQEPGEKLSQAAVTAGYAGPRVRALTVFGTDDRQLIGSDRVASYPASAQCKLFLTFPDGATFVGSGTLVSARYVLTAAHCVYSADHGGWARSVEVVPGLAGNYKPFGSAWATFYRTYTGWTNGAAFGDDFALITLDREIGRATGWFGFGTFPQLTGVTGNLAAYPGDRDNGLGQYFSSGPIELEGELEVYYRFDMMPGESGGGVYQIVNGQRYIFGVNAYENDRFNFATRITPDKYQTLLGWINSGS